MTIRGGLGAAGKLIEALRLFDAGLNTAEIAVQLLEDECVIAWCVAFGRDARLQAEGPPPAAGHGDAARPA